MVLARGLLAGAKIALIVGVNAVGDRIETVRLSVAFEHGEQFVFAVETTHGIVALVGGIFQFLRFHHGDGNFVVAREGEGLVKMRARQARGVGDDGQHLSTEGLVRHPGEKGRVDAAGVGDDQTAASGEEIP